MSQKYPLYVPSLQTMRALLGILFIFTVASYTHAQRCIDSKDLTFSLSGGAAMSMVQMDTLRTEQDYALQPNFGFAFTYSLSNRFALGLSYDRTDAERNSFYDKSRVTSYSLLAAFRPIVNDRNYLEARAGIGTGITAFRQRGRSFYSRGEGGLLRAGLSWVRFLTDGFGLKFNVSGFVHNAEEINAPDGEQEWFSGPDDWVLSSRVRMATVGLLVRY